MGRLITQWALSSFANLDGAQPYVDAAEHLFARAVADAWNADGTVGLAYTTDWNGKPVVTDRMHWTLAESLNTSATLYAATGEEMYATGMPRSPSMSTNMSSTTRAAPGSTSSTRTTT